MTVQCLSFKVEDFRWEPWNGGLSDCNPASLQEQVTEEKVQRMKQRFMSAYDITADGKLQIQEVFQSFGRVGEMRGNCAFVEGCRGVQTFSGCFCRHHPCPHLPTLHPPPSAPLPVIFHPSHSHNHDTTLKLISRIAENQFWPREHLNVILKFDLLV